MESNAARIQRQLAEVAAGTSATSTGLVVEQDWDNGFVTVNIGGTEQRMQWVGSAPWVGDRVRVVSAGGSVFCMAVYGTALGTVITTSGGRATVVGDDSVEYVYPHVGSAPANGARVRLDHAGRGVPAGTYSVEPADSEFVPPPPPPAPPGGSGSAWFNPAWSGNWRPGFAGSAVEISSSRMGMYGYGTQIRDTVPDSATVVVAQLHLAQNWDNYPGVNNSMGLHGFNGLPGSASNADLAGVYGVPGGSRAVDITGAIADALKVGSALGVGFRSGSTGYRRWKPRYRSLARALREPGIRACVSCSRRRPGHCCNLHAWHTARPCHPDVH